jgi:DNA-binding MarR family transcriptional regulator
MVIKQLKADKHITLVTSTEDKREKIIKLTPQGEAFSQKLLMPFFELNKLVGKKVGIDLLNNLAKGLTALGDAMEMEMELKELSAKWEEKKKNNETKQRKKR